MPVVAGRSVGVAYATWRPRKRSKKKGENDGERERLFAATVQRRNRGRTAREAKGWRWVNSGEILLVSVKDGPWSALVSWRRRGFNRASRVPRAGVVESESEGWRKVVGRESASGRRVPKGGARSPRGGARGLYPSPRFALSLNFSLLFPIV